MFCRDSQGGAKNHYKNLPRQNRRRDAPTTHALSYRCTAPRCTARNEKKKGMAPLCSAPVRPPRVNLRTRGRRPARVVIVAAGVRVSGAEARASLVLALVSQALATSQRRAADLAAETVKYAFPSRRFEPRTLEEALMSGQ
jgi:hypothetical protein